MYECKIAEKLSSLRNEKGVTQEEVAQALNISNKTISKWENGSSMPDLVMLVELAKYYNVTTDSLLDIAKDEKKDTLSVISNEFQGLDRNEMILKAFEISRSTIFGSFNAFSWSKESPTGQRPIPTTNFNRSCIISKNYFNFTVNTKDVNASVMLLPNESNFSWMLDTDKQDKFIRLLRFLCDKEALDICYFIHCTDCPKRFTSEFVSKNTGIPQNRVEEILDEYCSVSYCSTILSAHLSEGKVKIYECYGDGIIMSIITLAYERACGSNIYNYHSNAGFRPIGGK